MLPPTYYGQRDNGCHESEKMPIFMAFLSAYPLSNRLGNGTTAWSTRHTQKRLCVWSLQRIRILQRIRADCNAIGLVAEMSIVTKFRGLIRKTQLIRNS